MPDAVRQMAATLPHPDDLRAYVEYLRDLGIYDLLAQPDTAASTQPGVVIWAETHLRSEAEPPSAKAQGSTVFRSPSASSADRFNPASAGPAAPPRQPALTPFDQAQQRRREAAQPAPAASRANAGPAIQITPPSDVAPFPSQAAALRSARPPVPGSATPVLGFAPDMPAPTPFNQLAPLPASRISPAEKPAALEALRNFIGDCTRCPLAYAGRHSVVFADGDANARLMFIGEGPGADEDEQGLPFVGKAGQLLNNMITAMGLRREQVYIANVVKCRPPKNRVPEPVEANTCSPFLLQQIDIVQPEVIVALGGTAATYLLGVKQSLTSLRGQWFDVRGARCAVTYHPAFLLRDPRQKGEAWKDLQRVMTELKLNPPARA